jgi:hypothetical protein
VNPESDELLAKVLENLLEQRRLGEEPDLDGAAQEHPDLGER